ncbi:MAG: TlpA disulfide reductase family protein [candidate division WOR-3 bacterium]|nr:TlpA disulfide reductase family protein [candidate division WOR-3 bacterium]
MKKVLKIYILTSVLLTSVGCSCSNNPKKTEKGEKTEGPEETMIAPGFTLKDLNDNEITLSDYRNKVVILDFWATWCPPCKKEIPYLIQFYQEYKDKGLIVLGIGLDKKSTLESFSKSIGINYPVLIGSNLIAKKYGIRAIPTTFILNRKGKIKKKFVGYAPGYENKLKESFLYLLKKRGNE